jgi:FkbM family methyltransferase
MLTMNCSVGGATFRMLVSNDWERFRVETVTTKEPETVEWILENFRAGDTLFDIGANIGIYSILAAAWNPEGTVVAVEPMPANFARLCQNAVVNELQNLRPYCVAVAARTGLGTFNFASLWEGSSMHSIGTSGATEQFGETVVFRSGIGLVTMDDLAGVAGAPSLIKIDVDGGEDDVLASADGVLRDPTLRSALVEFNWPTGSPGPGRRDRRLLDAGFMATRTGTEFERNSMTWRNTIYSRAVEPADAS